MVLDASLLDTGTVLTGLKRGGWVLVNSNRQDCRFGVPARFRLALVDASGIAVRNRLGSSSAPIVNTAILGAFARVTGMVGIDSVAASISAAVPIKKRENVDAARQAYDLTEAL